MQEIPKNFWESLKKSDILQQIQKRPILLYTIHVQYVKMQIYVYMEDSAS